MTKGEEKYGWIEGTETVRITEEAYRSILSQAQHDAPIESCGYALGTIDGDGNVLITENRPLTNIDHSAEHFSFDPKEQFAAVKYARQNGLQVIGNWHSHPASPSRPSEEDKRLALDPNALYLILSLAPDVSGHPYVAEGQPVLNAFRIKDGTVTRYPVLV
ncbi:MAG: M67 family metallopeptidase [Prevotella sp.]|nr:M67 family metallopeptidase [Prevotella sp.]MBR1839675.1 M67 family metallopeptidase [Prevotella sp.]